MEFLSALRNLWQKYQILDTDILVMGVSGGVDSMVLLDLIAQIHPTQNIIVIHVDHSIRTESHADADLVEKICQKYGTKFEGTRVDIGKIAENEKISIEMAGRMVRYSYFEKVRALYQARFILTAHHQDDSIETVLINFIRGTRLRWLSGMTERQDALLRPLLSFGKASILDYAQEKNILYNEDSTNEDVEYVRNRVRHEILPQMEKINPMVRETLSSFSEYARELDYMTEWLLSVHLSGNTIREEDFAKLPHLLQLSFLEKVYASIHGGTIGLSAGNLEELRRFVLEARGGTLKELGNLRLEKRAKSIQWYWIS